MCSVCLRRCGPSAVVGLLARCGLCSHPWSQTRRSKAGQRSATQRSPHLVQQNIITYASGSENIDRSIQFYIDDQFEYKRGWRWAAVAISFAFVIVLRFVVAIATKYLHFQKR